ncbi:uncharacterized protein LOC108865036 [Galendromus occidentalis]|uniref:Uncharacterized protein LOC108865036 n=1 Tax=Galendromus occidentalis TaxID=34638 RepID=A0AAJ7L7D2_9ACAR|nr:uncharacterized protein LOC108865036 [Galendromus occidentalis]
MNKRRKKAMKKKNKEIRVGGSQEIDSGQTEGRLSCSAADGTARNADKSSSRLGEDLLARPRYDDHTRRAPKIPLTRGNAESSSALTTDQDSSKRRLYLNGVRGDASARLVYDHIRDNLQIPVLSVDKLNSKAAGRSSFCITVARESYEDLNNPSNWDRNKAGAVDAMHSYAKDNKIDIMCLVETWLTEGVTDAELSDRGNFQMLIPKTRNWLKADYSSITEELCNIDWDRRLSVESVDHMHERCILENTIVSSNDSTRFYGYASARLKLKDELSTLIGPDGSKVFSDQDKSGLLCELFERTYLEASDVRTSSTAVLYPSNVELVDDVDVSEDAVLPAISETKCTWSTSPEMIPAGFFKRTALGVAQPSSLIYRKSMNEGVVSRLYRTAWIAPPHKKGQRSDPNNKRPVSLTSVSCRILEKIICNAVLGNAERQNLISSQQHVYRKNRSTTDNLLSYSNFVACALNKKCPVDAIYTDFKSAFENASRPFALGSPGQGSGPEDSQMDLGVPTPQELQG